MNSDNILENNSLKHNLLEDLKCKKGTLNNLSKKVSIFGCNDIGMACAVASMFTRIPMEICLIDPYNRNRAHAEMFELEHWAPEGITLTASSDIANSSGSDICIMCIDKASDEGKHVQKSDFEPTFLPSAISAIKDNTIEYERIVPLIALQSPKAIFIVTIYPYTFMTYTTWKSSKFPINRVFGMGTIIETIHFRNKIAQEFDVAPSAITGYVIGAMNFNVPLYSEVSIAGTKLIDINDDADTFYEFVNKIFQARTEIYKSKGHPNFSIGAIAAKLIQAIFTDSHEIFTISTKNKGFYGLRRNLFLSMPAVIGSNGALSIINPVLTKHEKAHIQKVSDILYKKLFQTIIYKIAK